jgi:hypothetical protein
LSVVTSTGDGQTAPETAPAVGVIGLLTDDTPGGLTLDRLGVQNMNDDRLGVMIFRERHRISDGWRRSSGKNL